MFGSTEPRLAVSTASHRRNAEYRRRLIARFAHARRIDLQSTLSRSNRRTPLPEDVRFAFKRRLDRAEIAEYLRTVADSLENGAPISLEAGEESVTVTPPSRPTFEITAERETSSSAPDGPGELGLEFELERKEGEDRSDDGDLTIE